MALHERDDNRYTYADCLTWREQPRYELVDGEAYAISPGPDLAHQDVAFSSARQVAAPKRPARTTTPPSCFSRGRPMI